MIKMEINKSTRHAKLTGDFGESLILYWLSKYGFECALIDHTGIDIIARNTNSEEIMGISVKSRCRVVGREERSVHLPNDDLTKAEAACEAFRCTPYFAFVVDAGNKIWAYIVSMEHLLTIYPKGKRVVSWQMKRNHRIKYSKDPKIISFIFKTKTTNWW